MGSEEFVQKFARPVLNFVFEAIPVVISVAKAMYAFYKKLPILYVQLIIGTIMCFFGGVYPTVFAAIQAAEHGGLTSVKKALGALSEEVMVIVEENKKDNKKDDDGDGVADSDQMEGRELVKRKVKLVLTKMDPEKVNDAIGAIYKVWLSVLAVLTIQFAKTVALALTVSDFTKKFADRYLLPIIRRATPPEYQRWCPVIVGWFCKSVGMSIAWRIQSVISALASALAGGLIMARAIMLIRGKRDHEDSSVDEIVSYVLAGVGFRFQYKHSFDAPFPLNLILFPVGMAEQYIRWAVTGE